jgi:hypothetical protein
MDVYMAQDVDETVWIVAETMFDALKAFESIYDEMPIEITNVSNGDVVVHAGTPEGLRWVST